MIRDESCLNMLAIEFRMQGDHEEVNIFLQNCLISSRFNQKLGLQRNNMGFYRKFHRENHGPSDSLKDDLMVEIGQFKGATILQFSPFLKRN